MELFGTWLDHVGRADCTQRPVSHQNCSGCSLHFCCLDQVAQLHCNTASRVATFHFRFPGALWCCTTELIEPGVVFLLCSLSPQRLLGIIVINESATIARQRAGKGHLRDNIQCRKESKVLQ